MSAPHEDAPVTVSRSEAQRLAQRELAKPQYHDSRFQAGGTYSPTATAPAAPPPTPPAQHRPTADGLTIVLVIAAIGVIVIALILVSRRFGRPRTDAKRKKKPTGARAAAPAFDSTLTGAAKHRHDAENAAAAGQWAQAIRERFRAVIATLDEHGVLPDRRHRTAAEAAADAGALLPGHAPALTEAARAFDEVEYGRYPGGPNAYATIAAVDESVLTARPVPVPPTPQDAR